MNSGGPGEYVCHRRLHGFESFLAARILLAGAGLFLAFEYGQDVGLVRVLLVPHEHLTDQARSGLLGGPEMHGRLGQVLARLKSHLDQLRPHIPSLLDRAIRSATPPNRAPTDAAYAWTYAVIVDTMTPCDSAWAAISGGTEDSTALRASRSSMSNATAA